MEQAKLLLFFLVVPIIFFLFAPQAFVSPNLNKKTSPSLTPVPKKTPVGVCSPEKTFARDPRSHVCKAFQGNCIIPMGWTKVEYCG